MLLAGLLTFLPIQKRVHTKKAPYCQRNSATPTPHPTERETPKGLRKHHAARTHPRPQEENKRHNAEPSYPHHRCKRQQAIGRRQTPSRKEQMERRKHKSLQCSIKKTLPRCRINPIAATLVHNPRGAPLTNEACPSTSVKRPNSEARQKYRTPNHRLV